MTSTMFLTIILFVSIIGIVVMFSFQTYSFMNLKKYHNYWVPIYQNRIKHFDKYLTYALNHRNKNETIKDVAYKAACLNYKYNVKEYSILKHMNENVGKKQYIKAVTENYIHELRCANIE